MSTAAVRTPTWVSEADVARLVTLNETIDILRPAYAGAAQGEALALPRAHVAWDGGLLHCVGGIVPAAGVCGIKTWAYTSRGARPFVVVFATADGAVRGLVDAVTLGRLRTAATAAIGTDHLARRDASTLALIGTGRQALSQALAVAAVRPLTAVRVFGRDPDRRGAFAATLADSLPAAISEHGRIEDAVDGADIITTVTRAQEPLLRGALLAPGVHVNAVGAIVASNAELDTAAVRRADIVAVDSRGQAREDARDLRLAVEAGVLRWVDVLELGEFEAAESARGRTSDDQVTLLRTLGLGIADIALAHAVLQRFNDQAKNDADIGEDRKGTGDGT